MKNLVETRNLTREYGDFALRDVNLVVPEGGVVGLVGENGAGKTTLLRLIMGLVRPSGGTVTLMGGSPADPANRAETAVVFEDSFFFDGLNAGQIGRVMAGTVVGWDDARYAELRHSFGLEGDKPVRGYSKGMRMKLNLAVALARRPRLLLLDEPTSGLDPVARGELMDILLGFVQDEKNAVLISSHITSDLERIADQIAYLHEGRLLFQRDKLELMEDMAVVRGPAAKLDALPGELVIARKDGAFGASALVRDPKRVRSMMPEVVVDAADIDDMMRFYSGRGSK